MCIKNKWNQTVIYEKCLNVEFEQICYSVY
jgi:hypothetical protein